MARNTRQQRRERRRQAADGGAVVQSARARRDQIQRAEPAKKEPAPPRAAERGPRRFVAESWGELKKVEWPGQNQVIQGTVVVLIACTIVGIYLYANDVLWKHVIKAILR
jgi:preprotein translocase subunit SecE